MMREMREGRLRAGVTLMEVLAASVILPVAVFGTATALLTAARINKQVNEGATVEVTGYAQQFLEEVRNHVADDDTWFENQALLGWQPWTFTGSGTVSIELENPDRMYCVARKDCDGDGTDGDCYAVSVKICWGDTSCPAQGAACS